MERVGRDADADVADERVERVDRRVPRLNVGEPAVGLGRQPCRVVRSDGVGERAPVDQVVVRPVRVGVRLRHELGHVALVLLHEVVQRRVDLRQHHQVLVRAVEQRRLVAHMRGRVVVGAAHVADGRVPPGRRYRGCADTRGDRALHLRHVRDGGGGRIDDERAEQAHLHLQLRVGTALVEVGAWLRRRERVGDRLAGVGALHERREIAVGVGLRAHRGGSHGDTVDARELDRGRHLEVVLQRHVDGVPLGHAQDRAGELERTASGVAPCVDGVAVGHRNLAVRGLNREVRHAGHAGPGGAEHAFARGASGRRTRPGHRDERRTCCAQSGDAHERRRSQAPASTTDASFVAAHRFPALRRTGDHGVGDRVVDHRVVVL